MNRLTLSLAALLALTVLLTAAEWVRERPILHGADLRVFDADAVARIETGMWRSYYERRPARLFRQMITLLESQYGMPPLWAVRNGYRAAHAAFVFKDGRRRSDYEKVLPDLERYYEDVSALATHRFDARRAARLELEWWIVHREDPGRLPTSLADLQSEIYGTPAAIFDTHARLRAEAMQWRDLKDKAISEADWKRIGQLLRQSWIALHDALPSPK